MTLEYYVVGLLIFIAIPLFIALSLTLTTPLIRTFLYKDCTSELQDVIDNPPAGWTYEPPVGKKYQCSFVYDKPVETKYGISARGKVYKLPDTPEFKKAYSEYLRVYKDIRVVIKRGRIYRAYTNNHYYTGKLCLGTLSGRPAQDIEKIPEMFAHNVPVSHPERYEQECDIFYTRYKIV